MTDFIDAAGYRANVGMIVSNKDRQVLWAGRKGRSGWQFPQGGIGPDETPEEAMYRELLEEVGLRGSDVEVLGCTEGWLRYDLPKRFRRRGANPVCIGQKQRWFLLRMVADEDRVQLDCADQPEFDRWRWVDFWHPVGSVIWFKRKVYESALNELAPLLFPEGPPPRPR
ncbi:MAG: RNA pyrophosphohydrolase [Pseudomonadota bacterium]